MIARSFAFVVHRISVQIARAGCLAQSRADTGCKFREAMRLRQSLGMPPPSYRGYTRSFHSGTRLFSGQPEAMPPIIMPAWQNGTPHAMHRAALQPLFFQRKRNMKFIKILNSFLRCDFQARLLFVL